MWAVLLISWALEKMRCSSPSIADCVPHIPCPPQATRRRPL